MSDDVELAVPADREVRREVELPRLVAAGADGAEVLPLEREHLDPVVLRLAACAPRSRRRRAARRRSMAIPVGRSSWRLAELRGTRLPLGSVHPTPRSRGGRSRRASRPRRSPRRTGATGGSASGNERREVFRLLEVHRRPPGPPSSTRRRASSRRARARGRSAGRCADPASRGQERAPERGEGPGLEVVVVPERPHVLDAGGLGGRGPRTSADLLRPGAGGERRRRRRAQKRPGPQEGVRCGAW